MERDFLVVALNPGPYFLGMSFVTQRWQWWSDSSEVTWQLGLHSPQDVQVNERNCAIMSPDLDENGWSNVGCESKDINSLICQRGKEG